MADEWEKVESIFNIWIPTVEGDTLEGEVLDVKESNFGLQYTIRAKDGEEYSTPSHKVLQNRLNGVVKGDSIRIVFVSLEPPKVRGQFPMRMYDVFKKKKK